MLIIIIIYTLIVKKEISKKFPKIYRFFNRLILDKNKKNIIGGHIICFSGFQGSGKTYNSIDYIFKNKKKYNNIYSNVKLNNIDYIYFDDIDFLLMNDVKNSIIFIDEIQYILDDKIKDSEIYYFFCTLRKRGNIIICTSQIFERVDLKIREQIDINIQCKCYLGVLNVMYIYNNVILTANNKFSRFYNIHRSVKYEIQNDFLRSCYNTFDLPIRNKG